MAADVSLGTERTNQTILVVDHEPVHAPVDVTCVRVPGDAAVPGAQVSATVTVVQDRGRELHQVDSVTNINILLARCLAPINQHRFNKSPLALLVNLLQLAQGFEIGRLLLENLLKDLESPVQEPGDVSRRA